MGFCGLELRVAWSFKLIDYAGDIARRVNNKLDIYKWKAGTERKWRSALSATCSFILEMKCTKERLNLGH